MALQIQSQFQAGDVLVRFVTEPNSNRVGLMLIPATMEAAVVPHRTTIAGVPEIDRVPFFKNPPAVRVVPLVQLKLVGDAYSTAFAQGRTMLLSGSNDRFALHDQLHTQENGEHVISTILRDPTGLELHHTLRWHDTDSTVRVQCQFVNGSATAVTLEMLSSFSIGGITPFDSADASGRLRVHRFRSVWSAEGRLDSQTIEQLHLERSWSGSTVYSERFGQIGSTPVRGWFPFAAIEDTAAGVTWGAQLAWAGSWQMEIARQHDDVILAGGLADREFGHWMKTVQPGETLAAPPATLACVQGDLDALCDRLTEFQQRAADQQPAVEADLPIVFNEWCTTWGDPTHDRLVALAKRLRDVGAKYLVIDDGWFVSESGETQGCHGDWIVNTTRFPHGLAATAAAIRDEGLIPGLWFEMETVARHSAAFGKTDWLLHRDGLPLTVGGRRFWDLSQPAVLNHLSDRVIGILDRCGIGYMKVDYNETIGLGAGRGPADSLGEGLHRQINGVYQLFDRIRTALPNLVIENCASGGHRLEPSMVGRTAMSSFSDAHELLEIPIIAASVQRLILPRQSQIWAVLHADDSEQRMTYSLAATFLGRMCLSGEIDALTDRQMNILQSAVRLYREAATIIKHGTSRRFGAVGLSWRHPTGWQGVVRTSHDGNAALAVVHRFAGDRGQIQIPLNPGAWKINSVLAVAGNQLNVESNCLVTDGMNAFDGVVVLLRK